jgi:putative spermidine/putrescine transport system ATP-binding protein
MSAYLQLDRLTKVYTGQRAADAVTLQIGKGEMIVLLGPSGCGKTTTLRMIAGFIDATEGDITLEGRSIIQLPAHRREMGMVFQNYALFPHLTVAGNVAFGLEMRGMAKAERNARVAEMLALVKLERFADRLPRQMSGGQQQRVAIARALAIHPKVLLLDEPLSNLDAELRQDVAREIRLLQQSRQLTTIMVTHDQQEAMAMADRLVVMRDGKVQQVGRQEDLYERPANAFVARFIGNSNLLTGTLAAGGRFRSEAGAIVALAGDYAANGAATLAVRPERIMLQASSAGGLAEGTVLLSSYMGAMVEHVVQLDEQTQLIARAPSSGVAATERFAPGSRVGLNWPANCENLFDAGGSPVAQIDARLTSPDERITSHA